MITLDTIFRSIINFKDAKGKLTLEHDEMFKNFRSLQELVPGAPEDPAYKVLYHYIWDFVKNCDGGGGPELPSYEYIKRHFESKEGNEGVLAVLDKIKQEQPCEGEEYRSIIREYREDQSLDDLERILTKVNQIARYGVEEGRGRNKRRLKGMSEAVSYFATQSRKLETEATGMKLESQIVSKEDAKEFIEDYEKVESDPMKGYGVMTGIDGIDKYCGGLKSTELMLVAAYTEQGKTTFALNMAYRAIYEGWNVAFISLEMGFAELRRKIYTLHTCNPKFKTQYPHLADVVGKLDINNVTYGGLSPEEKELLVLAAEDLGEGDNDTYGYFDLWQPSNTVTTLGDVEFKLREVQHRFKSDGRDLDFAVIDYITLLGVDKEQKTRDHNQDLNNNIKALKNMCLTFNKGQGLRALSPFQVSRAGYKEALKNEGRYDSTALSNAHEAERSADVVISLWVDNNMREAGMTQIQNLKNRRNKHFPITKACVSRASGFVYDAGTIDESDPVEIVSGMYGV